MRAMISRAVQFVQYDLWRIRAAKLPRTKSFFVRTLRIMILSFREFGNDNCSLRASALTFFTLLSIVPIFAMAFGIAKGFGLEHTLQARVLEEFRGQEEAVIHIIRFAQTMLEETRGGVIAGIGILFLFWAVMRMLGNIERAFNTIWGVEQGRSIGRKFVEYLSLMIVCPLLLVISGSLTVFITGQVMGFTEGVRIFGYFSDIILFFLGLLPVAIIWGLLTFLYVFMPNTHVRISSAFTGAVIAGTIYLILQWAYINSQVGVARFGAIYGSFAALPLFLIWLQLSWLIVLYGAEIAFAYQSEETYELEPECLKASHALRKALALQMAHTSIKAFQNGEGPVNLTGFNRLLEIPARLSRQILGDLVSAGILVEVQRKDFKDPGYQPARPLEALTIKEVTDALEKKGINELPLPRTREMEEICKRLHEFDESIQKSPANVPLKDL